MQQVTQLPLSPPPCSAKQEVRINTQDNNVLGYHAVLKELQWNFLQKLQTFYKTHVLPGRTQHLQSRISAGSH